MTNAEAIKILKNLAHNGLWRYHFCSNWKLRVGAWEWKSQNFFLTNLLTHVTMNTVDSVGLNAIGGESKYYRPITSN